MPYIALFVAEASVEVAVDTADDIQTIQIPNTDAGIDELADWLRTQLPEEAETDWVATVPRGDGGPVYAWLVDAVPELFLQNPAPLRAFADRSHADWQSARTLLQFQQSKVW
jgi:hypothetical protein